MLPQAMDGTKAAKEGHGILVGVGLREIITPANTTRTLIARMRNTQDVDCGQPQLVDQSAAPRPQSIPTHPARLLPTALGPALAHALMLLG